MTMQKVGLQAYLDDALLNKGFKKADEDAKKWASGVSAHISKIASVGQGLFFTINGFSQAFQMLGEAMSKPIDTASDYDEEFSKFNVVFGEYTEGVRQWAKDVGNAETGFGRSEMALLSMLSTLQDTFVPMGFARKEASELSKQLTELAVDVASFNNKLDEDVIADFQSAIVGNHETVRKYGIVITEATLKQEALSSGIAKDIKNLTNEEKIRARLNLIIKGTTDAQGDALRTAQGNANTRKRLNAMLEDTYKILGDKMIPAHTKLLDLEIGLVKSLQDLIAIPTSKKIDEERIASGRLWNVLEDVNASQEIRAEALNEINDKYGDYLPSLLTEKSSLDDVKKAQDLVNDALLRRIAIELKQEEIKEVMADQSRLMKAEKELIQEVADAEQKVLDEKEAQRLAQEQLSKTLKETAQVSDKVASSQLDMASGIEASAYASKAQGTSVLSANVALSNSEERLKKNREEQKKLKDSMTELNGEAGELAKAFSGMFGGGESGSSEPTEDTEGRVKDLKAYHKKLKKNELEFLKWKNKKAEEHTKAQEKAREEARKKREKAEEEHLERMIGLSVDMGDALVSGYNAEGLKGALKESLLVLLSFYEKQMLLEKTLATAKAFGGNPGAIAELAFITAGFEAVKASVRNFAEGGIVKARQGGMIARIGEAGHDEAVIPLTGSNAPFGDVVKAVQSLERTIKATPPRLIASKVKGSDLQLILDDQKRRAF